MAREKWLSMGARPEDIPFINEFERVADRLGLSEAQRADVVAWGLAQSPNAKREDLADDFHRMAEKSGIDPGFAGVVESWHSNISDQGLPEKDTNMPLSDSDYEMIGEIEDEMRKPKGESRYWRNDAVGEAMRDEYLELIEKAQGDSGSSADGRAGAGSPRPAPARKAELEGMMGDRTSAYWRGPAAEAMQSEYRDIVSTQTQGEE